MKCKLIKTHQVGFEILSKSDAMKKGCLFYLRVYTFLPSCLSLFETTKYDTELVFSCLEQR